MIEGDFLKHLNRMNLLIDKRISSNYAGERKSLHTGRGNMFKDHRMYSFGDDFRDVDWKVYGRTDKLHVKRYEEDKSLTTHIIIDASNSMDFKSEDVKKFEYACMLGLSFAYVAMRKNEKFVLSTFSDKLDYFKPNRGKRHFVEILDYLKNKNAKGKSKFEDSLASYSKTIGSRSMVVVISDFLYDIEEVKRSFARFKNCEIKLIQVLDEAEEKLKVSGDINIRDLETKNVMRTFIDNFTRKSYLKKKDEHRNKLRWMSNEMSAKFYSFTTDTNIFDSIHEVFMR